MKTIAPDAPASHTSARCNMSTPGAAVTEGRALSAVAAYAITHSPTQRYCHTRPTRPCRQGPCPLVSVIAPGHQRQRRLEQDVQIEQHRPVLDIVEIELDALLDFLFAIDLAAPAVHLRPAGDAGLDAMAREIAINGLVEQPALQSALHGVRARADQRQVALEYDIEELRQLVEAGPADEAADAGDAAVVPGHDPGSRRIGLIVIERAKLEDVDALVVEPEPLLTEQHRSGTVELDRQRDQRHQRRGQQQGGGTD